MIEEELLLYGNAAGSNHCCAVIQTIKAKRHVHRRVSRTGHMRSTIVSKHRAAYGPAGTIVLKLILISFAPRNGVPLKIQVKLKSRSRSVIFYISGSACAAIPEFCSEDLGCK